MLLTLHTDLQRDLRSSIAHIHDKLELVEERTDFLENQMSAVAKAHNFVMDKQDAHADIIRQLQLKISDLEDRSRWNNLKIRGIPETVKTGKLYSYLKQLFCKLLPDLNTQDLLIDRVHRIQKPSHLPASVPRDTLARLHYFHAKERIICATRSLPQLLEPFTQISLYNDISVANSQAQKAFAPVTPILQAQKIIYRWGFPTKLLATYQN